MDTTHATRMIQSWFDGLNHSKLATEVVATDFVYRGGERDFTLAEFQARVDEYRQRFPELLFSLDDLVHSGDRIGVAWTAVTRQKSTKGVGIAKIQGSKVIEFTGVMPNL